MQKQVREQRGTILTHGNPNRPLEDLTTNNYKDVVDEEFQNLFNFNFGVFVHGLRVVSIILKSITRVNS
jgi:hypothetical protein